MAECEGGCKTWVHLKCHNIQLGQDWYCDKCLEDVHTSKAPSDGVDDPMDERADAGGASPSSAPSTDAPGGASLALEANKSRAASRSPVDGALVKGATSSPDAEEKSSSVISGIADDIELDLTDTVSPDAKVNSQKKCKKVST